MKIALIGYGKMGHEIEKIAKERGNEVPVIIDALINPQDFTSDNLRKADVAIEFTHREDLQGAGQDILLRLQLLHWRQHLLPLE